MNNVNPLDAIQGNLNGIMNYIKKLHNKVENLDHYLNGDHTEFAITYDYWENETWYEHYLSGFNSPDEAIEKFNDIHSGSKNTIKNPRVSMIISDIEGYEVNYDDN